MRASGQKPWFHLLLPLFFKSSQNFIQSKNGSKVFIGPIIVWEFLNDFSSGFNRWKIGRECLNYAGKLENVGFGCWWKLIWANQRTHSVCYYRKSSIKPPFLNKPPPSNKPTLFKGRKLISPPSLLSPPPFPSPIYSSPINDRLY